MKDTFLMFPKPYCKRCVLMYRTSVRPLKAAICNIQGDPTKFTMSYRYVILIESKSKKRQICSVSAISMLPVLMFSFCIFYFRFCTPAENTIFLVILKIFHSGLDCTIIMHCLFCHKLKLGKVSEFQQPGNGRAFLHIAPLTNHPRTEDTIVNRR